MLSAQKINYQDQIDKAIKRSKEKKVLYLYDETGNRELLGIFSKSKVPQVRKFYRNKDMLNRLSEYDVRTTEPDTPFKLS